MITPAATVVLKTREYLTREIPWAAGQVIPLEHGERAVFCHERESTLVIARAPRRRWWHRS